MDLETLGMLLGARTLLGGLLLGRRSLGSGQEPSTGFIYRLCPPIPLQSPPPESDHPDSGSRIRVRGSGPKASSLAKCFRNNFTVTVATSPHTISPSSSVAMLACRAKVAVGLDGECDWTGLCFANETCVFFEIPWWNWVRMG